MNENIFREYDIRGIFPNELSEEAAFRTAYSFCELYPWVEKLVVASDPRLSSPAIKESVIRGFRMKNKKVIDLGVAPDPLFYFGIFHHKLDGGIMVSGSHNPKEYNGLTLHVRNQDGVSEDVIGEDLKRIKNMVLNFTGPKGDLGGELLKEDLSQEYIDYISSKVNIKKSLKVVIDSGNGAMGLLAERVFKRLGCEADTIFPGPDGNFPNHLPDPYEPRNLEDIKREIIKGGYDIGFAFDADGDRVAPIDQKAMVVSGDDCMLMLARQASEKKRGPVVHCMRVSAAFLNEMKKQNIETFFSTCHHNAVIEKVIETGAIFGGEITYHFLFPLDYYLVDDALFASLKIAEIVAEKDNFAEYLSSFPHYFASPEIFIEVEDDKKFGLIEKVVEYLRQNNYNFVDIDGARVNSENGWFLVRASNTSPYIKCRFEGRTEGDLRKIIRKSLEIFKKTGIPISEELIKLQ